LGRFLFGALAFGALASCSANSASAAVVLASKLKLQSEQKEIVVVRGGGRAGGFRGGYRGFYGRRGWGPAIGGFAAGAVLAPYYYGRDYYYAATPVYSDPNADPSAVAWCARRYKSYDPASGSYLAYDGNRYACP
jgi:hypothetical protein